MQSKIIQGLTTPTSGSTPEHLTLVQTNLLKMLFPINTVYNQSPNQRGEVKKSKMDSQKFNQMRKDLQQVLLAPEQYYLRNLHQV